MRLFISLSVFIFCGSSWASQNCWELNQITTPVGTQCEAGKGMAFVRVQQAATGQMGWRDLSLGGKTWYDAVGVASQLDAQRACDAIPNQTLPTQNDYKIADTHGITGVLQDLLKQPMMTSAFWTSDQSIDVSFVSNTTFGEVPASHRDSYRCVNFEEPSTQIQPCVIYNSRITTARPGTKCLTRSGDLFQRVLINSGSPVYGWQDMNPNGKIWFDEDNFTGLNSAGYEQDASNICKKNFPGGTVPTKEDFEGGIARNFFDVLYFLGYGNEYWTSTLIQDVVPSYLSYNTLTREFDRSGFNTNSVACVGNPN